MFKGTFTAIVTPFDDDGKIDYPAFEKILEFQIKSGISGIVPVGTTGESPTLTHAEHSDVIKFVYEKVAGRVPVIAGTGSNSTAEAVALTAKAKEIGVAASLQVAPYYNKPTRKGMYLHFKTIAEEVDLPLVIYNIPGRTGKNIETSTIVKLSEYPNIIGVKEASGDMRQIIDVITQTPDDFCVLSGDDGITLPLMAAGGSGVISVASNLVPVKMVEFVNAGLAGDFKLMQELQTELLPLFAMLGLEQNPIPIKAAMALKGLIKETYRLPMCGMEEGNKLKLSDYLKKTGII